jgi:putative MATE family efflux protein
MATTATSNSSRRTLWPSLLEAVRGTQQDFTEGSISRAILLLATPMVLEMFMESLFAIVDIFWVSRLGADAVTTVGLTESMLSLIFAVALGVCFSTTAMVARRIGEKDQQGAATAAVQAIALGLGLSVVMGVPGFCLAPRLLGWMGASPAVIHTGYRYTSIVLGGNVVVMLLFLINAIFRGAGDASAAMRVLWVSNLINLALDPCLIFGLGVFPALGVTGAAVSTLTGRSIGVAYQLWILFRGHSRITVRRENLGIVPPVLRTLARISATGVMQNAIAHTSWVALVRIISTFGSSAMAGYTIGMRVFIFALMPAWGLSGAAATMVGQNLGARKPARAQHAVLLTGLYNMLFLGLTAAAFVIAPEPIVRAFTSDSEVSSFAVDCLRIVGYGNLTYAFEMVIVQAFNGAGDTLTPTLINLVGFWICEIPLAWMLAYHVGMGVRGVFASIPISETLIAVMGAAMFFRGRWKLRVI